ncbi:hypothetical protein BJV78DRAFT_1285015 [Lactifluus subvellereus]|nr:hypothetical protein BJV78DRAFT_1285015 [Lactifluus subvellereus]
MSTEGYDMPLSLYEERVRNHALLMSISFLILLPIGALIPRYLRTFTNRWWWAHWLTVFLITGPLIFAGLAMAVRANHLSHYPIDHHKKVGYAIISLYSAQLLLGVFIHFIRVPFLFVGHRPPQNYLHVMFGFAILAMAGYQIHYGLYIEWPLGTGDIHPIKKSAKHAWLALLIIFWSLTDKNEKAGC